MKKECSIEIVKSSLISESKIGFRNYYLYNYDKYKFGHYNNIDRVYIYFLDKNNKPKIGDLVFDDLDKCVKKFEENNFEQYKIIASNNEELLLPLIPDYFLKLFVKEDGNLKKVYLETKLDEKYYNLKLNNNEVLILSVLNNLDKEININDTKYLAELSWEDCDGCTKQDKNMWINGFQIGYNRANISKNELQKIYQAGVIGDLSFESILKQINYGE